MASRFAPEPPVEMPPARTVHVPGRGEFFVRDTGGDGPPLLLLHGWTASADLNWYAQYGALARAGYRVIALDHRGHGRGLRALNDFDLTDCADDAVAVLQALGAAPALVAGYSMGGPISLLAARARPRLLEGRPDLAARRPPAPRRGEGDRALRDVLELALPADRRLLVDDGRLAGRARARPLRPLARRPARRRAARQRADHLGHERAGARLGARHRRGRARTRELRRAGVAGGAPPTRRGGRGPDG